MTTTPIPSTHNEPSMRLALWLAFGLGLAVLALSTYILLNNKRTDLLDTGGLLGWPLIALSGPIIGSAAAVLTARGLKKSPGAKPVPYYVFRALRLFRYLVIADIALMPVIVLDGLYEMLKIPLIFATISMCYDEPGCVPYRPVLTPPTDAVSQTLAVLIMVIGLWGLCLLFPTLGAVIARLSRNAIVGVIGTWVSWGLLVFSIYSLTYWLASSLFNPYSASLSSPVSQIILAGLPYVLTALILLLSLPNSKPATSADSKQTS